MTIRRVAACALLGLTLGGCIDPITAVDTMLNSGPADPPEEKTRYCLMPDGAGYAKYFTVARRCPGGHREIGETEYYSRY